MGHIRMHKVAVFEACPICSKSFEKGSRTLWGHIRRHNDATYEFDLCGAKFKEGRDLKRHVNCLDLNNKHHNCDICSNMFFHHEKA